MRHYGEAFKLLACCLLFGLNASQAHAQTIYRIVGPDGKVSFSDKPPADAAAATATNASGKAVAAVDNVLPYELRQVVNRYPVTLYSGATCAPCNSGRILLQSRGIPFTEFTISTNEDVEALQRISGDNSLPFLTVGGQKIKGYSEAEWVQFLNAANYPLTSSLPPNYRSAAAKPLVTMQRPAPAPNQASVATASEEKPPVADPIPAPTSNPSNPGGIKF